MLGIEFFKHFFFGWHHHLLGIYWENMEISMGFHDFHDEQMVTQPIKKNVAI